MADFIENLWHSIFTPGPTPTLLVATNVSFAALQLLFFALLVATYSIHFIILSALTAGLWWAINWFAGELRAAQAKEEEAKRIREARREKEKVKGGAGDDGMDSGDDTEVETEVEEKQKQKQKEKAKPKPKARVVRPETQSTVFVEKPVMESSVPAVQMSAGPASAATKGTTTSLAPIVEDAVKKRRGMGESTGELSTDSEWEKLSEDSGER